MVPLGDAQLLQRRRPAIAAIKELLVGQPQATVDHSLAETVQTAGPAGEVKRRQGRFHGCLH